MIPLTCVGRLSEDLLGAMRGSWLWKIQLRTSGVAMVTMGTMFQGVLCHDSDVGTDYFSFCYLPFPSLFPLRLIPLY